MNVMLVCRAFVLRNWRILFIQRSIHDRNNPGLWEVPGGKVENNLPLQSLKRELGEEVGLKGSPISPMVAGQQYIIEGPGNYTGMLYLPLYTVFQAYGEVVLSDEHSNLQWLTWEEAVKRTDLTPATAHMLTVMEPWLRNQAANG